MIDSSVHILPGVDDGAQTVDQAVSMLELAKADGITHWIVTPHFNYEYSQYNYDVLRRRYDDWFKTYGETYANGNLLFGVEVFVDHFFLENLSKMSRLPTFENSHYMLVEFDLNWTYEQIIDAIIILKAYGIIPILAHIEKYPDLINNPNKVKLLSDEGVLIQLTASSFLIKSLQKFIRELMSMNALDLVASDGHDSNFRTPILSKSYEIVRRYYSNEWANRLFNETPLKVFYGEHYYRPVNTVKLPKSFRVSMGISVVFGLTLILVGISQLAQQPTMLAEATEMIITEEAIPAGIASSLTYDEIINKGSTQLHELQQKFDSDLWSLRVLIISAHKEIPNWDARISQIDIYLNEVVALEKRYDTSVSELLDSLEEELELNRYSTVAIEDLKNDYEQFKELVKTKYLVIF